MPSHPKLRRVHPLRRLFNPLSPTPTQNQRRRCLPQRLAGKLRRSRCISAKVALSSPVGVVPGTLPSPPVAELDARPERVRCCTRILFQKVCQIQLPRMEVFNVPADDENAPMEPSVGNNIVVKGVQPIISIDQRNSSVIEQFLDHLPSIPSPRLTAYHWVRTILNLRSYQLPHHLNPLTPYPLFKSLHLKPASLNSSLPISPLASAKSRGPWFRSLPSRLRCDASKLPTPLSKTKWRSSQRRMPR